MGRLFQSKIRPLKIDWTVFLLEIIVGSNVHCKYSIPDNYDSSVSQKKCDHKLIVSSHENVSNLFAVFHYINFHLSVE